MSIDAIFIISQTGYIIFFYRSQEIFWLIKHIEDREERTRYLNSFQYMYSNSKDLMQY